MAIPIAYNVRSARERWSSSLVAVLGIAGTVAVFVAMLALARGFRATVTSSGLPQNVIVQRAGADTEMTSALTVADVRVIEDAPQVARRGTEPLVSAEVVVIAALPLRGAEDADANVQMRGLTPRALLVRDNVRVAQGRLFRPGLYEIVVGRNAVRAYAGIDLGADVRIGPGTWKVVGILDAGGSAFDSEVWADADVLNGNYQRPPGIYQSATARLRSADDFQAFEATITRDPRLQVQAVREPAYYARQSQTVTTLITVLGGLVALVMGLGAILGALNTMYSAVAERSREIAVLRALGFGRGSVVLSFLVEALCIAAVGGLVGCIAVLPVNGVTTGTINWQTFSHLSFAFRITPDLLALGFAFAVVMGVLGGLPPAIRASRANVATSLRAL
jgi:putative ABC transport system permease protein